MSKATMNWADDDGSSDEGSTGGDEVQDSDVMVAEEPEPREPPPSRPVVSSQSSGLTVHVSNLAYSIKDDFLGNFFAGGGCKVKSVTVHMDRDSKRSRGTAHVQFADPESLRIALTANNTELEGRRINIVIAEDRRGFRGGERGGRGGGRHGDGDRRERHEHHSRDRDRDRRDRDGPQDHRRGPRPDSYSNGRGGDRSRGERGGERGGRPSVKEETVAPDDPPAERPKVNLLPRTLPVEAVGAPVSNTAIFGEGKPRDELAVEGKKKAPVSDRETVSAPAAVAPPPPPVEKEKKTGPVAEEAEGRKGGDRDGPRREKGGRGGRGVDVRSDRDKEGTGARKGGRGERERTPRGGDGAGRGNKSKGAKAGQGGGRGSANSATAAAAAVDPVAEKVRKALARLCVAILHAYADDVYYICYS